MKKKKDEKEKSAVRPLQVGFVRPCKLIASCLRAAILVSQAGITSGIPSIANFFCQTDLISVVQLISRAHSFANEV